MFVNGKKRFLLGLLITAIASAAIAAAPPAPDLQVRATPSHPMIATGEAIELPVAVLDSQGQPYRGELLLRRVGGKGGIQEQKIRVEEPGRMVCHFQAKGDFAEGLQTLEFRRPGSRAPGAKVYIDVLSPEDRDAFRTAAGAVKLEPLPAHLLFLGDSLTDLGRGYNYVDKLGYWLNSRFDGKATVKNAGVGGDTIVRIWERLNREPKVYRAAAYEGIFEPRPTWAFVFVGHNDSKQSSASQYRESLVAPATFETTYCKVLEYLRKRSIPKLTVISATSSVYEITAATAEKSRAQKKAHNLFGRPEALEQFNDIARRVAKEAGADYLDVYEPTRRFPDKRKLFTADGVHLSNEGHRLIALEILRYLGKQ